MAALYILHVNEINFHQRLSYECPAAVSSISLKKKKKTTMDDFENAPIPLS